MGRRATGKSLSGLYLRNCKVKKVDTWVGHWLVGLGVQHHGLTLILTFDLAVVTLSLKIMSGLYLGNHKV